MDGEAFDEAGGCAEFEAGADAEAKDGGEDGVGADEGYGEELEVTTIAEGEWD